MLERGELEDIDDWRKDLVVHDISVWANLYNSWLDVVAWTGKPVSTVEDTTALSLDLLESLYEFIDTLLAVHWAHESVGCHWVSNDHIPV